jgi:acyl-lipid omega-6 desaturase (Delta-12 desaturase)
MAMWALMVLGLRVHYLVTLAFSLPAIGMLVRIFIIQHDCGHGSFTKSKRANNIIGFACGVVTLTPYSYWRRSHAIHHATASQLDNRGTGDVWTMTIDEYARAPRWRRLQYRLFRTPFFLFFIAPVVQFVVLQRFPWNGPWRWSRQNASILWTNLLLLAIYGVLIHWIGCKAFIMVQLPLVALMGSVGMLLFYVQHQFEGTYWAKSADWDYETAALRGSSFFKLPRILQWFTGNIGFHHIHHLSHRIPNYNLQRCHDDNPRFQNVNIITLRSCLRTLNLQLWDEERQLLVSIREANRRLKMRALGRPMQPAV